MAPEFGQHPQPSDASPPSTGLVKLKITILAIAMVLLMLAPVAIGVWVHVALGDAESVSPLQRSLLSITAGLVTMLVLNFAVMLPMAHVSAMMLARLQTPLSEEDQRFVQALAAQYRPEAQTAAPALEETPPDE